MVGNSLPEAFGRRLFCRPIVECDHEMKLSKLSYSKTKVMFGTLWLCLRGLVAVEAVYITQFVRTVRFFFSSGVRPGNLLSQGFLIQPVAAASRFIRLEL